MSEMIRAVVRGTGSAVPARIMTNEEISQLVDTSDEWIVQRTGIRERRVSSPTETSGTLGLEAAKKALAAANFAAEDLELIIVATISGDYVWPATSCVLQEGLGASKAAAFDMAAACAGYVYAVSVADSMIRSGQVANALVVGADCLTKQLDWTDRGTCILFGDGAAATLFVGETATGSTDDRGVLNSVLLADGSGLRHLNVEVGAGKYPIGSPQSEGHRSTISMAGNEVYRFAVHAMGDACERVLARAGLDADDVDLFVPHQANIRIIDSAASRLKLPPEKVFVNLDRYGNTSSGSIPMALDEAVTTGSLKPGMLVLTVGFGGGLVWGANLIRW